MKNVSYYKLSNADPKGGLEINDSEGLSSIIGDMVKSIGSNFLKGNFNILKIRKPIRLYAPQTLLTSTISDLSFTDIILKAADTRDPIERIKLAVTFLSSGVHIFPFTFRSKAPLELTLGETYQGRKPDGTQCYAEAVGPESMCFLVLGPDNKYKICGSSTVKAEMNGMNGIRGVRVGRSYIHFKDGGLLEYVVPELVIDGLAMGTRVLNFDKSFTVIDSKNGLIAQARFGYGGVNIEKKEESFGSKFMGIFGGGAKSEPLPHDSIVFTIKNIKTNEIVAEGNGAWTGQIYFSGKKYWSFDDDYDSWEQTGINLVLPSDSLKRKDVIALQTVGNYKEAEAANEQIWNIQKDDQFFREQNKN